jgi:two-component system, OmpR family, sensor histidine kinase VicK
MEQKYGLKAPERTEVILGFENMLDVTRYGFSIVERGFDSFWDAEFVSIIPIYFSDGVKEATRLVKEKGIKIRIITEVKETNLTSVKQLLELYEVRHIEGIKGNFGILDRRQYIVMMFSSYDKPPEQTLFSNSKKFVEQQQYVFDTLWERAIPANVKIRQIEMAYEPEFVKYILNQQETNTVLKELIDCSTKEILILLPSQESFNQLREHGIFDALISATLRHVEVRIIIAGIRTDDTIHQRNIRGLYKNISLRYHRAELSINRIDIIIDYKFTLSFEENHGALPDGNKEKQLAVYSNKESKAMVSSSIFENYSMKAN